MSQKTFFSKSLQDVVVDGVCECGHLERDHGGQTVRVGKNMTRVREGGSCCVGKCICSHFVWARWMTATEFAKSLSCKQEERLAESA